MAMTTSSTRPEAAPASSATCPTQLGHSIPYWYDALEKGVPFVD